VERNRFGPGEEELGEADFEGLGLTFEELERGGGDRAVTLENRGASLPPSLPLPPLPRLPPPLTLIILFEVGGSGNPFSIDINGNITLNEVKSAFNLEFTNLIYIKSNCATIAVITVNNYDLDLTKYTRSFLTTEGHQMYRGVSNEIFQNN
jgi:hypothetical protein